MYDDLRRSAEDNPTVGIILCAQKDKSIVRYSVLHGNEQRLLKENMLNADDNEEGGQP